MPTSAQVDAILPFLDRFTAEGFTAGTWHQDAERARLSDDRKGRGFQKCEKLT
jgi:hypothetical protein